MSGHLRPLGPEALLVVRYGPGHVVHDARSGERLAEIPADRLPFFATWTPLSDGCVLVTGGREPNGAAVADIWRVCLDGAAR